MEKWDRIVLDVSAVCANLEKNVCSCLVYILLVGCDSIPYPYGKGNITVLNNLFARDTNQVWLMY